MKAKELMIGDWVIYKGEPTIVYEIDDYYQRINTEPDGYDRIKCIDTLEIEPIPLTPEILAKMGFTIEEVPKYDDTYTEDEYTATMKCVDARKCNVEIEYRTYRNEITVFSHDYHNILQYRSIETQVEYVHELQHILRVMKVDKELELLNERRSN